MSKYNSEYNRKYFAIPKNRKRKRIADKKYQRKKRATLKGYKAKEFREYRRKYPEKVKAQQLLNYAIRLKKIKRAPCEVCGTTKRVHGHHNNYGKPYKVKWLCPVHHKQIH